MQPFIRIAGLVACCRLAGAAGAQSRSDNTVTDPSEFTVRRIPLTPVQMLDSVMAHRPQNYPAYLYDSGRMDAAILSSGSRDTLFYAGRPVWLERGEFGVYSLYGRVEDKGRQLVNRATPLQTERVINLRAYPDAHGLGTLMESARRRLKKGRAFYGSSVGDGPIVQLPDEKLVEVKSGEFVPVENEGTAVEGG